jgi:hypothetical protein
MPSFIIPLPFQNGREFQNCKQFSEWIKNKKWQNLTGIFIVFGGII